MMQTCILYQSKYGATKQYVDLLKQELACDVYRTGEYKKCAFEKYDAIVLAGGIYASGIAGMGTLRKIYKTVEHKKIAVFCVGASPFEEKAFAGLTAHNLKGDLKGLPVFYGRGAWDEAKMNGKDRFLCKMLLKAISKKTPEDCEPWMKGLLEAAGRSCDWIDKEYLTPLLAYLRNEG